MRFLPLPTGPAQAARARARVDVSKVSMGEDGMTACDVMLSESQERTVEETMAIGREGSWLRRGRLLSNDPW